MKGHQVVLKPRFRTEQLTWFALLTVSLAWVACLTFSHGAYARGVIRIRHAQFRTEFESFDAVIPQILVNDGSVLLKFFGVALTSKGEWTVARYYYRGNYIAFPHRFYVLPDNHPFSAKEVIERGFLPGLSWYQTHHVRSILKIFYVNAEKVVMDAELAPE